MLILSANSDDPKHSPVHRRMVQTNWVNTILATKETQKEENITTIIFIVCRPTQETPSQRTQKNTATVLYPNTSYILAGALI